MAYTTFTGKTDKFEIMTIANIHTDDIDSFSADELIFVPLGGSAEIGMNVNLYHYNNSWIMIDVGGMFGNSNLSSNELIMPNIDFLIKNNIMLDGLILTHAHEDHIGAVPFLYEKLGGLKIFTTSFTASVLKRKFDSIGIKDIDITPGISVFFN